MQGNATATTKGGAEKSKWCLAAGTTDPETELLLHGRGGALWLQPRRCGFAVPHDWSLSLSLRSSMSVEAVTLAVSEALQYITFSQRADRAMRYTWRADSRTQLHQSLQAVGCGACDTHNSLRSAAIQAGIP